MSENNIVDVNSILNNDKKIEFYKQIGVEDWLQEKGIQTIRFNDRIERRENGVLHSLEYPAVDYNDNNKNLYYLEGKQLPKQEWEKISNLKLTKIKLDKILDD